MQIISEDVVQKSSVVSAVSFMAGALSGACTSKLVVDILDNASPTPVSPKVKVMYGVGGFIIGDIVGEKACEHIEGKVTDMAKIILAVKAIAQNFDKIVENSKEND